MRTSPKMVRNKLYISVIKTIQLERIFINRCFINIAVHIVTKGGPCWVATINSYRIIESLYHVLSFYRKSIVYTATRR